MEDIIIKSLVEKAESLDKKITDLQGAVKMIPRQADDIQRINKDVETFKTDLKKISYPMNEIKELTSRLKEVEKLFRQPLTREVFHHHHVPKIIWVTACLFIGLTLVITKWLQAKEKLNGFVANDTKYRYLKLSKDLYLQHVLFGTDSLYQAEEGLRDSVQNWEEIIRRRFELERLIKEKEKEIGILEEEKK